MNPDYESIIRRETRLSSPSLLPEIKLHLADKVTPLWKIMQESLTDPDCAPPFWAFAWVGGLALARYILDHPEIVRGKRVLDFASGCGLGGIAAAKAGAKKVWFCDIDPFARQACRMNADVNGVMLKDWGQVDMNAAVKGIDIVIAGDVCYEHIMGHKTVAWLRLCAAAGVETLLADPGRAYAPSEGIQELARLTVPATLELEDAPTREVTLWRLEG
jgi:predicted nicotinamide N-methyase